MLKTISLQDPTPLRILTTPNTPYKPAPHNTPYGSLPQDRFQVLLFRLHSNPVVAALVVRSPYFGEADSSFAAAAMDSVGLREVRSMCSRSEGRCIV